MVTDMNGMGHEPAGTPHGGRFTRKAGAGADDLEPEQPTDTRTPSRVLIDEVGEYGELADIMRPAEPGERDDTKLAIAWHFYDPGAEDSEFDVDRETERFAKTLNGPLHIPRKLRDSAKYMLADRIRRVALQPERAYREYGIPRTGEECLYRHLPDGHIRPGEPATNYFIAEGIERGFFCSEGDRRDVMDYLATPQPDDGHMDILRDAVIKADWPEAKYLKKAAK